MYSKSFQFIFLMFAFIANTFASKLTQEELAIAKQLTNEIISETHHSLDNSKNNRRRKFKLAFHCIDNPAYYLESNFTITRFLFGSPKYRIGINRILFSDELPLEGLKAILAHELTHSVDYYNGSTLRTIIPIGIRLLRNKSKIQYERNTDLRTVLYGYGPGLIAYKNWQYSKLSAEDLVTKKKEYLTPSEIEFIDSIRGQYPELEKQWLEKVPLNLEEFKKSVEMFL